MAMSESDTAEQIATLLVNGDDDVDLKADDDRHHQAATMMAMNNSSSLAVVTYKLHKKHVERRFQRNVIWGSIAWFIASGRILSRMGVRGAQLGALRKIARLGGGLKRASLLDVLHFKAKICDIKCRIYRPADQQFGDEKLPVCVFIHGGGWVMCTARTYHKFTLELCRDIRAVVVSVDYRLAPEHPWPTPLDDCLAVTRAVLNADKDPGVVGPELAGWIDVTRVVLAGDSAGGNLSSATALDLVRQPASVANPLVGLCLICPAVQAISTAFDSYQQYYKKGSARSGWYLSLYAGISDPPKALVRDLLSGRHIPGDFLQRFNEKYVDNWTSKDNKQEQQLVIPDVDKQTVDNIPEVVTRLALLPRAWPLLASDDDLARLPVTLIQTCSDDALKDEGLVFAERLQRVGVPDVRYFYLPRAQHCETMFHNTIPTKASRLGYEQIVAFLKEILGTANQQPSKQ